MQFIICDCGTELPFSERDLSSAAGKPFTCPICGRTRKLPLANVFTPAAQPARPAASIPVGRTKSGQATIIAAILVAMVFLLAGPDGGIRMTGILIACVAAVLSLLRVMQRGLPATLVTPGAAFLGGLALSYSHWSIKFALVAIVCGVLVQQSLEDRWHGEARNAPSDQWRLELRDQQQP